MKHALFLAAAASALAVPALPAGAQGAPYVIAETGRGFARLQDAVNAIGGGAGTIRIAPGAHADCAVQTAGEIAYVAAEPGTATFDGTVCEGKAALVLRGRAAKVEGLVFANMRVPEKNGAGIRLEAGTLAVVQSWFRDSEQGILTANDPSGSLLVDRSTFTRLGTCEGWGGCAHSLYVGDFGSLTVTRSRFEAGRGGHYVKSRAARTSVIGSSFDDSGGKATNYMIDLSGGATGRIANNLFVQGRDKENYSAFIAIAAEGRAYSSAGLAIEANDARFAPGVRRDSVFVADWSGDAIRLGDNVLGAGLRRFEKR